jgi:hypothetical protein
MVEAIELKNDEVIDGDGDAADADAAEADDEADEVKITDVTFLAAAGALTWTFC